VIAVVGPNNDNDNNDKDDNFDIASAIYLGVATLVLGARSFANPQDLDAATIVLRHCPRKHDLSESCNIGVASMMGHCPCKRDLSESCDISVLSKVRHDCLCKCNLSESRDIGVASMISLHFVVFRAMNLVMLEL
jgi:hypothetical protein